MQNSFLFRNWPLFKQYKTTTTFILPSLSSLFAKIIIMGGLSRSKSCLEFQSTTADETQSKSKSSSSASSSHRRTATALPPSAAAVFSSSPTSIICDLQQPLSSLNDPFFCLLLEEESNTNNPPESTTLELEPTSLYLPKIHNNNNNSISNNTNNDLHRERLYLPRRGSAPCSLDLYLSSIPHVASRAKELIQDDDENEENEEDTPPCPISPPSSLGRSRRLRSSSTSSSSSSSNLPKLLSNVTSQSCLNVLQGEMAHASSDQVDVLVSAEATTCHIVAVRSTTTSSTSTSTSTIPALVSLAHIDDVGYEQCLDDMIQYHITHHHTHQKKEQAQEQQDQEQGQDYDDEEDDFGFFLEEDEDSDVDVDNNALSSLSCSPPKTTPSFLPRLTTSSSSTSRHHPKQQHQRLRRLGSFGRSGSSSNGRRSRSSSFSKSTTSKRTSTSSSSSSSYQMIDMELHLVGGYLDEDGTSQTISNDLITTFSKLAHTYQDQVQISLSTAAISCLNTSTTTPSNQNKATPVCRGLGIDTKTGQVFAVKTALPTELEGPAIEIRSARAWAMANAAAAATATTDNGPTRKQLAIIHDTTTASGCVTIQPFIYQPIDDQGLSNILLQIPDDILLQYTSTSPDCESDRFCNDLRRTVSFLQTVKPEQVFGSCKSQPLIYSRSSNHLNEWEVMCTHPTTTSTSSPATMTAA